MKKTAQRIVLLLQMLILFGGTRVMADEALSCPANGSAQALNSWRDRAISTAVAGNYANVNSQVRACFGDTNVPCLTDLKYYVNSQRSPNDYRVESSNAVPVEGYTINGPEDLPSQFAGAPGEVKIPEDLQRVSTQNGWKTIAYKTRSTGGFDQAPNLTLIAIPGRDKDMFLQISPPPKDHVNYYDPNPEINGTQSTGQNTLTVITVDKTKNPPVGQLRLLKRNPQTGNYTWNNSLRSQGCISCHSSPLRTISPVGYRTTNGTETLMNAADTRKVDEINAMMIGAMDWGSVKLADGTIVRRGADISSQPYGWAPPNSPTRTDSYLQSCSTLQRQFNYQAFGQYSLNTTLSNNPPVSLDRVKSEMNCVNCHNGSVRGKLHAGFDFNEIEYKVLVDRSMPPGADLNMNERMALLSCLRAEFATNKTAWKQSGDWLRKVACTDSSSYRGTAGEPSRSGSGNRMRRIEINSAYDRNDPRNAPIELGVQR